MAPIATKLWHSLIARHASNFSKAIRKGLKALDAQVQAGQRAALEPVLVRNTPKQPLHPLARIRQSQARWFSTARSTLNSAGRRVSSAADKSRSLPTSTVRSYIHSSSGRSPFASTLRPNLTGGTLGRTAGGYTTGSGRVGGARYFSHGPASQAQVVQNVSQAVRAFFISGHKAQFDGMTAHGEKRFKAVSNLQDETCRKMRDVPKATPGSRIEFPVNPTITALTSLGSVTGFKDSEMSPAHLNTSGLLDILSVDFSRSLKELTAVLNDLKRLSALGDLPITYESSCICVHFPGCNAEAVESLCDELGVQRGTVIQDEAFDTFAGTEIALLFPFAPSDDELSTTESEMFDHPGKPIVAPQRHVISLDDMLSGMSPLSCQSDTGFEDILADDSPLLSSPSGYHSVRSGSAVGSNEFDPLEYQGFEGIYKFIQTLDEVRR